MPALAYLDNSDPWIRWDWLGSHVDLFTQQTVEHIQLTVIAVVVGLLLALPLALLAHRVSRLREPILAATGVLYVVPSIALFALLIPFTGLSILTAEIGLTGYTLLILIRNIVVGLEAVPADVLDAARGMGYRPLVRLFRIELPLALPAALAGIRIATVTTIGLVTVTALIGYGGLGQLILRGLIQDFKTPLVVGAVLSVALALVADLGLALVQRLATPWARS